MTKTSLVKNLKNKHPEIINIQKIEKARTITLLALVGLTILVAGMFFQDVKSTESNEDKIPSKSKYIIENLKGDKISTRFYWEIIPDKPLYVHIKDAANIPEDRLEAVKDVILSSEFHKIDDHMLGKAPKGTMSKYYLGWQGALSSIELETKNLIPKKFEMVNVGNSADDIIIILTNMIDVDGNAGTTKSIAYGNQIRKSEITIYDFENITINQLKTITRHEFGHALGLGHSTAPEDLMYPEAISPYPYISDCDISGIISLYDGRTHDEVICEK